MESGIARREAPAGWKKIEMPETVGLCHTPGAWWQGPDGHQFCAQCYMTPWLEERAPQKPCFASGS